MKTRCVWQRRAVEEAYRLDLLNPHPAIEWAFRWIDRQIARLAPTGRAPCVVHGDFRIGNMLYDEHGLTSILDWEGVHIGEPEEDLAWFCTRVWRFGKNDLEAGGIASREDWLTRVRARERRGPSTGSAWPRGKCCRTSVGAQITMMQARAHLDGHTNSHELAAIGRRTAETELEILRLAGVRGAGGTVQDRPTASELLDALGDFMRDRAAHARDRWERFQFQVAANSIGIISRELQMEDDFMREEWRGLDGLLGAETHAGRTGGVARAHRGAQHGAGAANQARRVRRRRRAMSCCSTSGTQ